MTIRDWSDVILGVIHLGMLMWLIRIARDAREEVRFAFRAEWEDRMTRLGDLDQAAKSLAQRTEAIAALSALATKQAEARHEKLNERLDAILKAGGIKPKK